MIDKNAELDRDAERARAREIAAAALAAYDLREPQITLLDQKKNVTFRVETQAPGGGTERFLLRLCHLGGYNREEILSELTWLTYLRHREGLLVPEPVAARDGSLVTWSEDAAGEAGEDAGEAAENAEPRWCALFRWVPGEVLQGVLTPANIERVGALLAKLHRCSERFVPPPGFARPRWDCDRLFGTGEVIPSEIDEPLITKRGREILDEAAAAVRETVRRLGEGPAVFGIIHKDLEPDNTVVWQGELHAIDFADAGWGWYLYDMAASLLPLREKKGFPEMRAAFLRGYRSVRPVSAEHEELLETFTIARSLFAIRLMVLETMHIPKVREYAQVAIPHILGEMRRFLDRRASAGAVARLAATAAVTEPGRMTTVQFLSRLRELEIKVWAEGEKLRFTAPQGALTPELKAELADRKQEVLAFLRQGQAAGRAAGPARMPVAVAESNRIPLSFGQQRLWFLNQLDPDGRAYNIARAVRLSGPVRVDLLERSLGEVIRRHAALRTTFSAVDGEPFQRVQPHIAWQLPLVDLRALPEETLRAEAQRLSTDLAHQTFDLARGPLLRVTLLRLGAEEHIAAATMHHIVGDGWSTGLLFREMGILYESLASGRPSPLAELPLQYADFSWWQRQHLQGEVLAEQIAYWKAQLEGAPEVLDLPTDRPRSAARTNDGARHASLIPRDVVDPLKALGQAEGAATLFMVLFAAFNAVLHRASAQDDVVVGFPVANRNWTEIEGLIGFFLNTLVLRTRMGGDPTYRELLVGVRQTTLGAYAHQDLPFEKLVEELRPERRLSETPVFQVTFSLQNVPHPDSQVASFRMSLMPPIAQTAQFDLSCDMKEMPEGVRVSWRYKRDLFDDTTIARLAAHYETTLRGIAADPDLRLSALPLLGEGERAQLLVEWSDTEKACPQRPMVHELVALHAAERPKATAVAGPQGRLTYGELDARANRLAWHLRSLGVGPEVRVAVCTDRSLDRVAGILGAVKAGAAYVSLDPEYPRERLAYLLDDAGAPVLLTERRFLDRLPETAARVLCLDDLGDLQGDESAPPPSGVTPDNLAYVVYTSGSTGKPKGVEIPHAGLMNLVRWHQSLYGVTAEDRGTQIASPAFDASIWELWPYLTAGASLHIPDEETRLSPEKMVRWWADESITLAYLMTPLAEGVLEAGIPEGVDLPTRALIIGGDRLRRRPAPGTPFRLMNHYGPAEYTVTSTVIEVPPSAERDGEILPTIGRAVDNTRIHVLDRHLEPVPAGVPGELFVGGVGLARGYAGRPELTAEKFVPDPFAGLCGEPGARLYRTADLVRWLPDGDLDFLGRLDNQVKLRGLRIELGEIETVLAQHPAVREAVVLVREDTPGDKQLVAYAVPAQGTFLAPAALREFLRERLPAYMVPAFFVFLDGLPMTPNGKVDRRALPAPDRAEMEEEAAEPRNAAEDLLAGIWAEVLGRDRVGMHENFFEIGGHSLLATQVVSRIRELFGLELPLQRLFEAPTVADLAAAVEAARRSARGLEAPPLVRMPREAREEGGLPLSFAQQRLWFLDQFAPGSPVYNIPAAVRLTGEVDPALLARALDELVRRHESLRTTFTARHGQPVQVIHDGMRLPLPLVDLAGLPEAARGPEARRLAAVEAARPFDLAAGPLARLTLVRLGPADHAALVTLHHVISDGWSMGVFLRELAALVDAFSRREPSPLPELPVQYADFAVWQRQWLAVDVLETGIAYWRWQLGDAPRSLDLPTDRPRPAVQTHNGAACHFTVPAAVAEPLAALSRREGVTLFMTLLAAFQVLLGRYSGQRDLVVGSPIAGRNRRELEGVIGFFVNTLVLRTNLSGDPALRQLLAGVRTAALDAYAHQDMPFERLVEELQPARDLSRSPLFQVAFALQNAPMAPLALPGLTLTPWASEARTAKFDLSLAFGQGPENGLAGSLEYNTDLFDGATVERMIGHLLTLLAAAADPERRISDLPLLTADERTQILEQWNDTAKPCPQHPMVHELVAGQARRRPGATAVAAPQGTLTYGDLDARANRLAWHLRALGVGPEVLVAACTDRTPERVIGLLAVLKAGGAYVSIDPTYPRERLAFLLEDARAPVLLTETRLLTQLPESGAAVICLDDLGEVRGDEGAPPASGVTPDNLAYVVYTSGSTGRPKGVEIPHAGLMNLVRWHQDLYGVTAEDRGTQVASPAFDAAVWELWPYLAAGASLHIPDEETRLSARAMVRWWESERITLAYLMTPLAEGVLETGVPPAADLAVRALIIGGDRLHHRPAPGTPFRLMNHYGPAEYTVTSTVVEVAPAPPGAAMGSVGLPTIGRAIDNTRIYVLDRDLRPAPVGVPGELYVTGLGLARGYLRRPDMTAEKFIPDPYAGEPGGRLYRTGDLVRWLPDGDLDFLGRLDNQVKLRGLRIELGEIEAVLVQHPGVLEAAVDVREDRPGEKRLAGYVVPVPDRGVAVEELRAFLRERLPEYMVPAAFVYLPALPLTPNGKVDHKALPAPEWAPEHAFVAPRTATEQTLARIWGRVLQAERVGVHDNFFEIGGHSLLATQVMSQIREELFVDLPIRALFASPTVAALAEIIETQGPDGSEDLQKIAETLAQLDGLGDEELQALLGEDVDE
ncbi:MAG TPA: amino acid adenylation domain-containing protein [Thermoanaerobaculia bacterium]|nr:amino acid adenylation domain-containing protein [Thermoanaerobaculia bacterium]